MRLAQKLANNKNPQFLSNPANILAIFPIHELIIFTQFHNDWMKIVDFYYWLISGPVSFFSSKSLLLGINFFKYSEIFKHPRLK